MLLPSPVFPPAADPSPTQALGKRGTSPPLISELAALVLAGMGPAVVMQTFPTGLQAFNPSVYKALGHAQNRAARATAEAEGDSAREKPDGAPLDPIVSGASLPHRHAAAPPPTFAFRKAFIGSTEPRAPANLSAISNVGSQATALVDATSSFKCRLFAKPNNRRSDQSDTLRFSSEQADNFQGTPPFATAEQVAPDRISLFEETLPEPVTPKPSGGRKQGQVPDPVRLGTAPIFRKEDGVVLWPSAQSTCNLDGSALPSDSTFAKPQSSSGRLPGEPVPLHNNDPTEKSCSLRLPQVPNTQAGDGDITAADDPLAESQRYNEPDAYNAEFSILSRKVTEKLRMCQEQVRNKDLRVQELLKVVSAGTNRISELTVRQELLAVTLDGRRRQEEMLRERITRLEEVVSWSQATVNSLISSLKDADDREKLSRSEIDASIQFRDQGIKNAHEAMERAVVSYEECKRSLRAATEEKNAIAEKEKSHLVEMSRLREEMTEVKAEIQTKIQENNLLACTAATHEKESQQKCRALEGEIRQLSAQIESAQKTYEALQKSVSNEADEVEAKNRVELEKRDSRICDLEKALIEKAQAVSAGQRERDVLCQRLAEMTSSLEETRSQKQGKIRKLQSDCNRLIDEKRELLAQIAVFEERIRSLTSDYENAKSAIPDPNIIAQLRSDLEAVKERSEVAQRSEVAAQVKLEETRILFFEQQAALSKCSEEVSKLRQNENMYLEELKCVRQKMVEIVAETHDKVIAAAKETREEMNKAYEDMLRRQRDDFERQLAEQKKRAEKLEAMNADCRQSICSFESEKTSADELYQNLQRRADELQLKVNCLDGLQSIIAERERECRNYELQVARLEADLEDLQNIRNANQEIKARLEQVGSEKDALSKSLASTRREYASKLSGMDKKLESMAKSIQSYIRENDVLKLANEQHEKRIAEYEREANAPQTSASRYEAETLELRHQADNLRGIIAEKDAEMRTIKAAATSNEQQISALSSEVLMLKKQIQEVNSTRDMAETKSAAAVSVLRVEIDSLRNQLSAAEVDQAKAQSSFAGLRDANEKLRVEANQLRAALDIAERKASYSGGPAKSEKFPNVQQNAEPASIMASPRRSLSALAAIEMNEESLEIISLAGDEDFGDPDGTALLNEPSENSIAHFERHAAGDNCPKTDMQMISEQNHASQTITYLDDLTDSGEAEFAESSNFQGQLLYGKKARTAAAGERYHGCRERQTCPKATKEPTETHTSKSKRCSKSKGAAQPTETSRKRRTFAASHTTAAYKALKFESSSNVGSCSEERISAQTTIEPKVIAQGQRPGPISEVSNAGGSTFPSVSNQTHDEGQSVGGNVIEELTLPQITAPARVTRGMKRRMNNVLSEKRKCKLNVSPNKIASTAT